nr:hypothetical protein [candidate division Zixibacteria bacterium]
MCGNVQIDGSFSGGSGSVGRAQLRNRVQLEFGRFNYVVYEGLGSHLLQGWAAFFNGLLSRASEDFWMIQQQSPNLTALFSVDRVNQIPSQYRALTSDANGRYIYFFIPSPSDVPGRTDRIIELHYNGPTDWDYISYVPEASGSAWRQYSEGQANGNYFELERWELRDAYVIALPGRVFAETIQYIFTENQLRQSSAYGATLPLCRLMVVSGSGARRRALVFDPAWIVNRTVDIINFHTRYARIVDARVPARSMRLNAEQQDLRVRGILACLCKQLVMSSGSIEDDANTSRLNSAFDRFYNYIDRKANFADNIYNFLSHPIMERMENAFMVHQIDGACVDGYVWMEIVRPLGIVAGEHGLLTQYFQQTSERPPAQSAWSTFFHDSLRTRTAQRSAAVRAWNTSLQGIQLADLAVGVAEIRAFHLVSGYTSGQTTWSNFIAGIRRDRARLVSFTSENTAGHAAVQRTQLIRRIFRHANLLGQFKAILDGEGSVSSMSAAMSALGNFADERGAKLIATRAMAFKNIFDLYEHGSGLADRLGIGDYDAAFGRALSLGVGITELGYILATGTTLGGPVGAIVGIIGVIGAVIVIFATDSEEELFMRHCLWGTQPRQGDMRRDWMAANTSMWSDSYMGVTWQLNSLINLLHKYDVRHNYQNVQFGGAVLNVLAIDIMARFVPDTARFEVRAEFSQRGGRQVRVLFQLRFPPRVRPRADRDSAGSFNTVSYRSSGPRIVEGVNSQVFTESGTHRIRIHIGFADEVTSANGWDGQAWIKCYPFDHDEFSAPHGPSAFHLENLISHDNLILNHWRDYSFERDEWGHMPSWRP